MKKMKNQAIKSVVQILAAPNKYWNLKHPRWVKLGTLFYATVYTLNQTFLRKHEHKNKRQNKILSFKSNKKTWWGKYYFF
jgi:hypothetical protein